MGAILQTCRYDRTSKKNRRMGKTENPSSLIETMEENKNKIPNAKSIGYGTLDGERTSM